MRVLLAAQMREADRRAVEVFGIPAAALMEAAAVQVVEAIEETLGSAADRKVTVVCGKGNNGGDGYAVARYLAGREAKVTLVVTAEPKDLSEDAKRQAVICQKINLPVVSLKDASQVPCDWVVDAVFGTGFKGPAKGIAAEAIEWINKRAGKVVSIDLPSGCETDTGQIKGPCVKAHLTVTLARPKPAIFLYPAAGHCGKIRVRDIGIPAAAFDDFKPRLRLFNERAARAVLPRREATAHKKSVGTVLVIAGSGAYLGAALLAIRGAFRGGAGFIHAVLPEKQVAEARRAMPEVVFHAQPGEQLSTGAAPAIMELAKSCDAAVIGPGLGSSASTAELVRSLYKTLPIPAVIDADAIRALAGMEETSTAAQRILTPHAGEMADLLASSSEVIEADRLAAAAEAARGYQACVLLKGPHSLVATPEGDAAFNASGNEALATAGSGDVLAGLISALMARGLKGEAAASLGAWLHGRAADDWQSTQGNTGLTATDLADALPGLVHRLGLEGSL